MVTEDLMRKYKYGYVHSCKLLEEPFIKDLLKENQELKKQLEEMKETIKKCGFVNIEQVMLNYCGLLEQKKEFIKYLEDEIERLPGLTTWFYRNAKGKLIGHTEIVQGAYKEILQKYKEIVNGTEQN